MNILVATKLNGSCKGAVTAGIALAKRAGAKLSVVSVVDPGRSIDRTGVEEGQAPDWVTEHQNGLQDSVEQELERAGVKSDFVGVLVGNPSTLVTSYVEESHSDLVVLGTHRSSDFERIIAGSTGEKIIRHSKVPVLVATQRDGEPFRRVIVAVDLSSRFYPLLDWASSFAWANGSEVCVVHSEGALKRLWMTLTFRGNRTFLRGPWRRFFSRFWETKLPGQPFVILRRGHAGRVLLREARKWDADLIIMGVRRFGFPVANRLGRTAKYVLRHGGRSVLAVPSRGEGGQAS